VRTYVLRRLLISVVMLLVLTLVTYAMFFAIPQSPGRMLVGENAPREAVEQADHDLGVDQPVPVQYVKFLWRLVHGDLGVTWPTATGPPDERVYVGDELASAAGVTASLLLGGFAMLLLLALPLGSYAALREGSRFDRLSTTAVVACVSIPPFVVGLLLQNILARRLGLFPVDGYCELIPPRTDTSGLAPLCGGAHDWASHLILPWLTFALFFGALYMGMTRTRMIEELRQPYVRTARSKGVQERDVVARHALRNAMLPLSTMLATDVGTALAISIYVETVFGLPGLGRMWVYALSGDIGGFDLPTIVGLVLVTGTVVIVVNLVLDLSYGLIDPRIREAGSRAAAMRRSG
jgi:peptide/nickel transport system permease protein